MNKITLAASAFCIALGLVPPAQAQSDKVGASSAELQRGRYMVLTGHCNNCHTAGYAGRQGTVPEKEWLLGNPVGYRSENGTTYGSNLRLTVPAMPEDQWVKYAQSAKPRAPMPWWSLHETSEQDLRAMYRYIKHLGPGGQPAPPFVPPDKDPPTPYEVRTRVLK